jgi:hypothetical protein
MKNKPAISAVSTALAALAIPVVAHHSFAVEFDGTKPTRLVDKVTWAEWTNLRSYFYVDIVDAKGKTVNWAVKARVPAPSAVWAGRRKPERPASCWSWNT